LDNVIYHSNTDHWHGSDLHQAAPLTGVVGHGLNALLSFADDHGTPLKAANLLHQAKNGVTQVALNSIIKARVRAEQIQKDLNTLGSRDKKESHLLKYFLVESLSGVKRMIAKRYLLEKIDYSSENLKFFTRLVSFKPSITYVFSPSNLIWLPLKRTTMNVYFLSLFM